MDALEVAKRFFDAIEAGDLARVREIYAPDVVVWHNTDSREKSRDQNLKMLEDAVAAIAGLRYDEVRLRRLEGGFVQQHVLRGSVRATGGAIELPAVVVCEVARGQITRLDEYFDPAPLAALRPPDPAPER